MDSPSIAWNLSLVKIITRKRPFSVFPPDLDYRDLNAGRTKREHVTASRPIPSRQGRRVVSVLAVDRKSLKRETRKTMESKTDRVRPSASNSRSPLPTNELSIRYSVSHPLSSLVHLSIIGRQSRTVVISRLRGLGKRTSRNLIINASPSVRFRRFREFRSKASREGRGQK